ncbi:MAG: hypothetical protein PHZ25_01730 [Candidatus Pacebacteria bacterium]|nr:hypothetical protein [Candidatus Paceibacterota bacterium]
MKKLKNNKRLEAHTSTIKVGVMIMFILFLTSFVSAWEWDNVKSYDEITKTATINNCNLWVGTCFIQGETIATTKLNTEQIRYVIPGDYVFEYEIEVPKEQTINLLSNTEIFYKSSMEKIANNNLILKYYNPNGEEIKIVQDYVDTCEGNWKDNKTECVVLKGTHEEIKKGTWDKINGETILPIGKTLIRGYYSGMEEGVLYEWIPTFFGVKVEEWATFGTAIRYEYYLTGGVVETNIGDAALGQSFKVGNVSTNEVFTLKGISIKAQDGVGNIIVRVYNTSTSTRLPTGSPLSETSFDGGDIGTSMVWFNISMPDALLYPNVRYAYLLYGDFLVTRVGGSDGYLGGSFLTSNNNGSSWAEYDSDNLFEIWGVPYISDYPPTVTLTSPIAFYNSTSQDVTFDCKASDDGWDGGFLQNITLYLNNSINGTNSSVYNDTSTTFARSLADGYYSWNCGACDNASNCANGTAQYFTIDTTAPVLNVNSPIANTTTFIMPVNITFNTTATDNFLSTCSYFTNESTTPVIFACNATQGINFTNPGWYWINYTANDTLGNTNSTLLSYYINLLNYSVGNPVNKIEGQNNTFYFNVSATYLGTPSAYLIWNNTNYTMALLNNNGTLAQYRSYFTAPSVTADYNATFNYSYNVAGTNYNSGNYYQTIYNIPSLNVTNVSCSGKAYNFTLKDEANLSSITGTFDYNFWYGTADNSSVVRTYGTLTNVNPFYVCINDTISNAWVLGSGEIFYRSTGYVDRRYYLFDNSILSNATTNITLYDLFSSDQTSFKLDVEDTSLNPYSDYFTTLVRWYPGLNEYNVVDMGKTDEKGTTIIHVKTEDVDYRIGVYYRNGTLVKLADPIRMACLTSPCTYTLSISPGDTDYTSIFGIEYTFDLNETTGIWTFVYSDPSLKTSTMNLTIYKDTGVERYAVCSTQTTGASGAMSCNTSLYTGTLIGQVIRSASPGQILVQKIGGIVNNVFTSSFGLWLSMLIAVPVIFFFAMMSPLGALIGVIVALIPALYFGSISVVIIGGIALLAGLVAHFIGRVGK